MHTLVDGVFKHLYCPLLRSHLCSVLSLILCSVETNMRVYQLSSTNILFCQLSSPEIPPIWVFINCPLLRVHKYWILPIVLSRDSINMVFSLLRWHKYSILLIILSWEFTNMEFCKLSPPPKSPKYSILPIFHCSGANNIDFINDPLLRGYNTGCYQLVFTQKPP